MPRSKKPKAKTYVNHPRFGSQSHVSGYKFSSEEIDKSYWRYRSEVYFAESAIPAETDRQNYTIYPRELYVDLERNCRQCKRPFIFFALEQKHWYEHLNFYIDSDCIMCVNCRKKEQGVKQLMQNYEKLSKIQERTDEETRVLKQTALELYQLGYIRNENKIRRIT